MARHSLDDLIGGIEQRVRATVMPRYKPLQLVETAGKTAAEVDAAIMAAMAGTNPAARVRVVVVRQAAPGPQV